MKKLLHLNLLLLLASFAAQALAEPALKLGVLAFRPKDQAIAQWQPLAAYLQKSVGKPVELSIYNLAEMEDALSKGKMDIVITNPGHYIILKQRHAFSLPLVTQIGKDGQNYLSVFGGVIFVRADSKLTKLAELSGKRFAYVDPEGLGGYQMQVFELLQAGVDLPLREQSLVTGAPQDKVVDAVLNRRADVGFVRSGVLESLVKEGKLELSSIRVINKQFVPGFPYMLSTRLYPEWPVVVSSSVDEDVAKKLAIALLSLPPGGEVAKSAGIYGFTLPSSYKEIENLLRSLHVPPFDKMPELTLAELWQKYAVGIALVLAMLLLVFAAMGIALLSQMQRVRQGQERFTTLFEYAPEPMWIIANGKFIDCNKAAIDIMGYGDKEATINRFPSEISPLQQPDGENSYDKAERLLQAVSGGQPQRFEWVHRKADSSEFSVEVSLVPVELNGQPVVLCAWHDITAKKQAEAAMQKVNETLEDRVRERTRKLQEQQSFTETILSTAGAIIVVMDADGRVVRFNKAAEELSGYRLHDVQGRLIWEFMIPRERVSSVQEMMENNRRNPMQRKYEAEWLARSGERHLISWNTAPIMGDFGQMQFLIAVGIDVTERNQAVQAVIEANQNLNKTVATLRDAQSQLVQAEKMAALGSLVAGISHEINTPIGIGMTAATTLQEELLIMQREFAAGSIKRSTLERYIAQALNGCEILVKNLLRAANLVSSFKQVAVDQTSDDWRDINLKEYVDEIIQSLRPKLKLRAITVLNECDSDLDIHTHPGALYQIITNLVINSLIHAYDENDSGEIHIRANREGDYIRLDYADDGKGIPEAIRSQIFDPFFTTRRGSGGSGLGLHIVFNLVSSTLHGVIYLLKQEGRGAAFRIQFPLIGEKNRATSR